jgi:hypothetical protein
MLLRARVCPADSAALGGSAYLGDRQRRVAADV